MHLFEKRTELKMTDRDKIEPLLLKDNFYSHFPMVMAMSETGEAFSFNLIPGFISGTGRRYHGLCIWCDEKELLFPIYDHDFPMYQYVDKIHISTKMTKRKGYKNINFGREYIYDLQETIDIKNFRHNYRRFERDYPNVEWENAKMTDILSFISEWYIGRYPASKKESETIEIPDLVYTVYLSSMYEEFPELRAKVITLDGEIKAFSLWGPLSYNRAVHIILKCDTSLTYLSDYARYRTYLDMLVDKFTEVNDGEDMGVHGLRMYKLKLRPKYVIPLYSWVLK